MRKGLLAAIAVALAFAGTADAKIKLDKSFSFPPGTTPKIIVFRPDVQVGSMGVGGVEEPNPDWTRDGRANLAAELEVAQRATGNEVIFLGDQEGAKGQLVADYQALFRAVAGAVVEHQMNPLAKLPTKKDQFDWTLGPGAAELATLGGGDYALFLYTHDAYGTAGRKVMQVLMAGLFGAAMPAGVHVGYAALVDLKTGNLVWFNVDPASGGDPRDRPGAAKRIGELFKKFPTSGQPRTAPAPAAAAKATAAK